MDTKIQSLINKINNTFNPISIFLYGSRARTDFLERSDYEIGVLYTRNKKISRTELKRLHNFDDVNIYPFEYEALKKYKIDTPFPETIYLRELVQGGKTLLGEEVMEKMTPPPITIINLVERIRFDTGFAYAAVFSYRTHDLITAKMEFSKSCLFGVRCLLILEKKVFPLTYDEIYEASKSLDLDKYSDVVDHAIEVRKGAEINELNLYRNISLLNKIIKPKLQEVFEQQGNITILE